MSELDEVRADMRRLILNTCNTIGCTDCPFKWEKDSDGNKCRSDYLMMKESELETNNDSN